ncbi:MAG: glycolate oxidase subunit GlcE [Betaproteobacteria bacterium RIFCSPLOWO2_12_FULL_63_13]|nr:MAG: glycolate oxidase subunit GlcE [Betaproteobacteria bacterium RIFCSPLOWO2_02_FULL_63_19]OGA50851.1 MAG: glycolate oxidase subunit GlcE [Betaproteobacteria bacterium RIFCSPLOWO2_12_FULL_63_13]
MSDALTGFAEAIRAASAAKQPLRLHGGGSKDFYGQSLQGTPLDCRGYSGIASYEPTELVVTARCGTPLADLEGELRAKGQMLAFEPPHFGSGATVGGMVAAGLSGPRRAAAGAVRDYVLGVTVMDARGAVMRFGGTVMKNVAGYDVSRLFAGSMGTLGMILDVSMKVLPMPAAEATLRFEMPQDKAIESFNRWAGRPLPVSASAWMDTDVMLRLSGATAVHSAIAKLGGERVADAEAGAFWTGIREHTDPFFRTQPPLWRISVPSAAPPLALPGDQMIEWGGALRWLATNADARTVREAARRSGGHATLFRGGSEEQRQSAGVFQPLEPALARIHRDLKTSFDPQGIFNRGRMYAEF